MPAVNNTPAGVVSSETWPDVNGSRLHWREVWGN